jgi:hypothetical protein
MPCTYKLEPRQLSGAPRQLTEYVIRDPEGQFHATEPADWTEADVAAQVDHLNECAEADSELRAKLGDDGYSAYRNQSKTG